MLDKAIFALKRRALLQTLAALVVAGCARSDLPKALKKEDAMNPTIEDVFLLITTDRIRECVDFYNRWFGFETTFDSPIYVQLASPEHTGKRFSLAFMPTNHPFGVTGSKPFDGRGIMLTIQTADSAALHEKFKSEGAPIVHPLTDEAWGQRRFVVRDPAGTFVDVVQLIEPAPGYYEALAQ